VDVGLQDRASLQIFIDQHVIDAYSGHRDHAVWAIVITRSEDRDRSSERSDAS
jgi:hypothetical protein